MMKKLSLISILFLTMGCSLNSNELARAQAAEVAGPDMMWSKKDVTETDYLQACRVCNNELRSFSLLDTMTLHLSNPRQRYIDCMQSFGFELVPKNISTDN